MPATRSIPAWSILPAIVDLAPTSVKSQNEVKTAVLSTLYADVLDHGKITHRAKEVGRFAR